MYIYIFYFVSFEIYMSHFLTRSKIIFYTFLIGITHFCRIISVNSLPKLCNLCLVLSFSCSLSIIGNKYRIFSFTYVGNTVNFKLA